MTDRINAITVVLDRDIREDDVEFLMNAIRALKHVIHVEGNVADMTSHIAYARARADLADKLVRVLSDK